MGVRAGGGRLGASGRVPLPEAASSPGLPADLQYLPQDKRREEEPDIRKMLLEAIMLVGPSGANHSGAEGKSPGGGSWG